MTVKTKRFARPEKDRQFFEVLRAIRGRTASELAKKTYVSAQTIRNWRRVGGTRYPQHHTMAAVAKVVGLEFKLVPIERVQRRMREAEERALQ